MHEAGGGREGEQGSGGRREEGREGARRWERASRGRVWERASPPPPSRPHVAFPPAVCRVAAVAKDHESSGLKPSRCVLLQLWKSEVKKLVSRMKVKVWAGLGAFRDSRGESIPDLFSI